MRITSKIVLMVVANGLPRTAYDEEFEFLLKQRGVRAIEET